MNAPAFEPMTDASSFRRMAAAMWRSPADPTIFGAMDLDATALLAFIDEHRARTGQRLTVTHLVSQAVARAFAQHPTLNAKVRFGGRLERRTSVDLFVSVSTENGKDLSGVRVDGADRLDLAGWVDTLAVKARDIRSGQDASFQKTRSLFKLMPFWLLRPFLRLVDVLANELHVHLPAQGLPRDPFGTAVITNVGSFGIDTAFAPFVPMGRCPMLLLINEVRERPWVVDGALAVRPVLRLCGTFDHRIIDGHAAGLIARAIRTALEQPAGLAPLARAA
ncbi:MAG: 2-oxo acid dehydrogenase subunit E2 [Myxococcaceae bacterium]|nr:2-oxo acid dehydrogenase subunit E2 [Myxococcaceae bacterium]